MESSWHDFSERCAVPWPAPWIVKPGGRGTEYDPECAWDDSCIYPPSNSAFVPAASIIVDQQCVSPNSAQYDSVERRDGEGGSVHPEADCDSLRSQQRLFNHPLAPLCLSKITGQDICLSICIEKTNDGLGTLACGWKNCKCPGPYADKGTLMRHLRSQHVALQSIKCADERCKRRFNRKDNMEEHLRRAHNVDRAKRSLPHPR